MTDVLTSKFWSDLWEIRDKRLDGWFMMDSPWPTVTLSALYVYGVTRLGPSLMRDRKPFDNLKWPMQIYNLFQVALSSYVVYEASMAGWATTYNWGKGGTSDQ